MRNMRTVKRPFIQHLSRDWLWFGVNVGGLVPLIHLVWMVAEAPLSSGPVIFSPGMSQDVILFSGKTALVLLVLSLACTPVARILGVRQVIKVRKSLGLWGFFYARFHALFFMGGKNIFLESAAWGQVLQMLPYIFSTGFAKTPYARYGALALALLIPLAFTSNRLAMRLLGKNWKRLHWLVYGAVPLAVYHYWQREEFMSDIEPPAYWQPVVFAALVGLLLIVRVPPVRRWLAVRMDGKHLRKQLWIANRRSGPSTPAVYTFRKPDKPFGAANRSHPNGHPIDKAGSKLQAPHTHPNGVDDGWSAVSSNGSDWPEHADHPECELLDQEPGAT
jgi:sulfoxide reductase heme-binding subunit YedZ